MFREMRYQEMSRLVPKRGGESYRARRKRPRTAAERRNFTRDRGVDLLHKKSTGAGLEDVQDEGEREETRRRWRHHLVVLESSTEVAGIEDFGKRNLGSLGAGVGKKCGLRWGSSGGIYTEGREQNDGRRRDFVGSIRTVMAISGDFTLQ